MAKMTIDKLAEMTQEQFSRVDERLDGIDGRLDGIDGRLDGIDGRLDGIDGRLDGMDGKLDKLQTGQERILEVLLEIPSKKAFERFTTRTEARFTALEKKVGI